jgi:hypothetical protein
MNNSEYRAVARSVLVDRGFDVRVKSGQGYLPGSRLIAAKAGKEIRVAVKASQQRIISFNRQQDGRWRTLHAVDQVIAVVPVEESRDEAEVLWFEKKALVRKFDRAWQQLRNAKGPGGFNMPVFVPIDAVAQKNVGHGIGSLKRVASWSVRLSAQELMARSVVNEESYIDTFRRRFAAENGVGPEHVMISIVGKLK